MNTRMAALAHSRKSSVRWRIFWFLLVLITINYVDRASLSVAMPLISKEFSLSPMVQGLILSSFFWSYTVMQIPAGLLVDRFKPRIVITVATLVWGGFQLTMHPHVTGYRSRIWILEEIIRHAQSFPGVWFATHRDVAEWALQHAQPT